MKAFITSIGEPTTDLCKWSLERNGFEVHVVSGPESLWRKLKWIYENTDENFLRVDADVIPNRKLRSTPELLSDPTLRQYGEAVWWYQFITFDWYKQDTTHGGMHLIKKEALPALRANIDKFEGSDRPESQMYRLEEFSNPRRCITVDWEIVGVHGYGQTPEDIERVKAAKEARGQYDNYDWDLFERMETV